MLWTVAGCGAIASLVHNAAQGLLRSQRTQPGCPMEIFSQAQSLYLKGDYFEAERAIATYCGGRDLDVEAALLLASIFRRTHRFPQAIELLDRLSRLERSAYWIQEIEQEKKWSLQQKIRSHADDL
jgi:Tfp pilus assembly protein PilF